MHYRRILTIQDISCVGQCSMTVALPILSACGQEVCILPSAVLSSHTGGFSKPVFHDLTDQIPEIWSHWKRENVDFDIIYTGYLGSVQAIRYTSQIMDELLAPGGKIIVDPAMADHGKLYSGLSEEYASEMIALCKKADVVLPNLTEAAMMTGSEFQENFDENAVKELLGKIDGENVVLTGVGFEPGKTGAAIRSGDSISFYFHNRIGKSYHGTGDIFAACLTGAYASGRSLEDAAGIAADFTFRCIENTFQSPAHWYGVKFETAIPYLIERLQI